MYTFRITSFSLDTTLGPAMAMDTRAPAEDTGAPAVVTGDPAADTGAPAVDTASATTGLPRMTLALAN